MQGTPTRLTADFSPEKMETRNRRINNQSAERNCRSRVLYLAKLSFKNKDEIKIFPDK